jgi:hypothetical protein
MFMKIAAASLTEVGASTTQHADRRAQTVGRDKNIVLGYLASCEGAYTLLSLVLVDAVAKCGRENIFEKVHGACATVVRMALRRTSNPSPCYHRISRSENSLFKHGNAQLICHYPPWTGRINTASDFQQVVNG